MATFTVNCDGSANSFENNGNIRVTYTAGNGSVTITEIEGMRTDGYSSYEDASQTVKITIGGTTKTINVTRVRFMASSAYATWGLTDTTWTGLNGTVDFKLAGLTHWSGAAYYNKTFTKTGAINAGSASYTVTYDAFGGSGAPSSQTKSPGTALTLSSTKPTKSGYNFLGWGKDNIFQVSYAPGASYTTDANLSLYAVWERIPMVMVKSGSSWVKGQEKIKSGSTWVSIGDVKLKTSGDF